jgi:hypothetical protein
LHGQEQSRVSPLTSVRDWNSAPFSSLAAAAAAGPWAVGALFFLRGQQGSPIPIFCILYNCVNVQNLQALQGYQSPKKREEETLGENLTPPNKYISNLLLGLDTNQTKFILEGTFPLIKDMSFTIENDSISCGPCDPTGSNHKLSEDFTTKGNPSLTNHI